MRGRCRGGGGALVAVSDESSGCHRPSAQLQAQSKAGAGLPAAAELTLALPPTRWPLLDANFSCSMVLEWCR